jgi:hypothetical protein
MDKHTPGPWAYDCGDIRSEGTLRKIAENVDGGGRPFVRGKANDANGKLLAAAPDLLAALRLAIPHVEACAERDELLARQEESIGMHGAAAECRKAANMRRAAITVFLAAIAKATGGEA